jgi:hypothetical protein
MLPYSQSRSSHTGAISSLIGAISSQTGAISSLIGAISSQTGAISSLIGAISSQTSGPNILWAHGYVLFRAKGRASILDEASLMALQ